MVRRLATRLARVDNHAQARLAGTRTGPAVLVVNLEAMDPDDQAAIDGTDAEAKADAVERQTGQRLGTGTKLILLAMRRDGAP